MILASLLAVSSQGSPAFNAGPTPLLMQHPTMNDHEIVFQFADDLWSVPRDGGEAKRLTSAVGIEGAPYFSPDGKLIAFSGQYDGNTDVYVMPADGGSPTRLTAHPDFDKVVGWTPDSKSVIFMSQMLSNTDAPRFFTVPATGGFPKALPLPAGGETASYSPDGKRLAYVPNIKWERAWKRYRGGQAFRIWIADLADSRVKQIPKGNENNEYPMWIGDKIYYLSDKRGPVGMFSYDTHSGKVAEEVKGEGLDIKSATAGPGGIVYEKLGSIQIYDPALKRSKSVPIRINADFTEIRPQFKDLAPNIESFGISPGGSRVVLAARGWTVTLPAAKGDMHLLDETQGLHRRDPSWSPDAKTIAYITDADKGRQQLGLWDAVKGKETRVELGDSPSFYYKPTWSPDSSKVAYTDYRKNVWLLDVKTGKNTKVDTLLFGDPTHNLQVSWSPDSKWITWSRDLPNHFNAIFLYNLTTAKTTQITDSLASADSPVFDRSGKYLYFFASTNVGSSSSWLDLSSYMVPNVLSSIYAVVLKKDEANPLQPESDEDAPKVEAPKPAEASAKPEAKAEAAKPEAAKAPEKEIIDLDGIESRIIALPMPAMSYAGLAAGPNGSLLALSLPTKAIPTAPAGPGTLWKFSFSERKAVPLSQGVTGLDVTPDGSKALIAHGPSLQIVPTAAPSTPDQGAVDLSDLRVKVEPQAEWKHMFYEIWENERNCFYAPNLQGLDSRDMERRYAPFLDGIRSRNDLNYLFVDMLGELCIGHEFPGGGDIPGAKVIPGGLLGADYEFANGHYRLTRVYDGERWNPNLYAPLAQPGVLAKAGEYILEIDGKPLTDAMDIYEALEGKAGKQVKVKIGPNPDGAGARDATVLPVASEFGLRQRAWAEDNRRYVEKMTAGRAGYVHVPDTAEGGWTEFQRYYYAHVGKDGVVVDERFNHGGFINDFMINEMKKTFDGAFVPRGFQSWPTPGSSIFGPKVMLANEYSGSGGDMFPWLFRHNKLGKLIGKRTWGGLVAAYGFALVDGGRINAPDNAFFDPETGKWDVENWGVSPDIEVELDPYLWRQGHDSQLDRAIEELNKSLANYKAPSLKHPDYPDKTKLDVRY